MAFDLNGRVGPGYGQDGSPSTIRMTKDLGTVTQDLHGKYYEASYRGNVFVASTAVAGVAPGTALSTTPPFTLYNPLNSGYNLSIISSSVSYISGTLGAGSLVYGFNSNTAQAAPTGGTALTPVCTQIGNSAPSHAKIFQGSTLAAAPVILKSAFILPAFAGAAGVPTPALTDILDGSLLILPGASISLQGIAGAGTAPLVLLSMLWEEVPV